MCLCLPGAVSEGMSVQWYIKLCCIRSQWKSIFAGCVLLGHLAAMDLTVLPFKLGIIKCTLTLIRKKTLFFRQHFSIQFQTVNGHCSHSSHIISLYHEFIAFIQNTCPVLLEKYLPWKKNKIHDWSDLTTARIEEWSYTLSSQIDIYNLWLPKRPQTDKHCPGLQ